MGAALGLIYLDSVYCVWHQRLSRYGIIPPSCYDVVCTVDASIHMYVCMYDWC